MWKSFFFILFCKYTEKSLILHCDSYRKYNKNSDASVFNLQNLKKKLSKSITAKPSYCNDQWLCI